MKLYLLSIVELGQLTSCGTVVKHGIVLKNVMLKEGRHDYDWIITVPFVIRPIILIIMMVMVKKLN